MRRVDLPPPPWNLEGDELAEASNEHVVIKHLPLGSRKNLCINPRVSRLGSTSEINDRCLELQQPITSKDNKCPFLPNKESETLVNDFRDHTLATIRDIEDLEDLGRKIGICPYYASRATIRPSEIVTLPYPLLLQKSAREALDLSLRGHVVIIDEAHNLMDAITSIYSVSISLMQLQRCRECIGIYLQRFRNRLKGMNRVYIAQLVRLLDSLSNYLESKSAQKVGSDGPVSVGDLMSGKGVDQVNLYKLTKYLQHSKLARKVEGYVQHAEHLKMRNQNWQQMNHQSNRSAPVLIQVQSFLLALTNPTSEGRFFYEMGELGEISLKYMLLDPTYHFKDIVEESRAIILAGGTMSPMEDYAQHLLPYVPPERMTTWSCGHIISKESLVVIPILNSAIGTDFNFTYEARDAPRLLSALGDCFIKLAQSIPDGIVAFFPSYAYLNKVIEHWKSSRGLNSLNQTVWEQLQSCKPVFRETKEDPVEETLASYSLSVTTSKGGLLLSIIGGKLSEGINFSDALGRGIIVVGLPFPNIQSAQWKAKLEYIEQSTAKRTGSGQRGKEAKQEFYENACMRAVNQSIGRAIRHKDDYAAIVLLDQRYGRRIIQDKLPAWIRQGLVKEQGGLAGRGHVSAGHGRIGKHRKHPGGRGMAGGQHHHRTNLDKYHPGYFGKVGMRYFHKLQNHFWKPVINLDKLWALVPQDKRDEYIANKKSDTAPVLDLLPLGYSKVLGKGRLPEIPLVVRARYFSSLAEKKIKEAGGVTELVA
ncbi:uncharacterized protein KY384_005963 [Bacidia gigantensis]|uniref:uncharacterized protein n=1 Tax=Bacidia gigantensis TaxID=2732470 RepID=UPI001D04680C|nr:uncharacterized protein KY384_005963 [Bacidia gigantensis]KAG8529327.1 hypothetical protein KY384_005963 [Bacidia gigantensis]